MRFPTEAVFLPRPCSENGTSPSMSTPGIRQRPNVDRLSTCAHTCTECERCNIREPQLNCRSTTVYGLRSALSSPPTSCSPPFVLAPFILQTSPPVPSPPFPTRSNHPTPRSPLPCPSSTRPNQPTNETPARSPHRRFICSLSPLTSLASFGLFIPSQLRVSYRVSSASVGMTVPCGTE